PAAVGIPRAPTDPLTVLADGGQIQVARAPLVAPVDAKGDLPVRRCAQCRAKGQVSERLLARDGQPVINMRIQQDATLLQGSQVRLESFEHLPLEASKALRIQYRALQRRPHLAISDVEGIGGQAEQL